MAKKVCIVLTSLSNGGTERFGATLSFMLSELGYEVYIFTTHNATEYPYIGQLFSLQAESKKAYGIIGKLITMHRYFKSHNFDIIIDNRLRSRFFKELLVYKVFYKESRIIAMIHNFKVTNYFPVNRFFSSIIFNKDILFVSVSKQIKERTLNNYDFDNVKHIYNPINLEILTQKSDEYDIEISYRYILYFGRFEEVAKNLTLLIKSYKKSELRDNSVKLILMGKGDDYSYLRNLVTELELNDYVVFMDYNPNPFPYVKQSLFTVLSSNYEGFPMSIIESLAIGTPVVSVNCQSGPSEIIQHRVNGLLVNNHDIEALSNGFNMLLNDAELYAKCKGNAKLSVSHIGVERIKKQWYNLIEDE